jgi:hypothetical protein
MAPLVHFTARLGVGFGVTINTLLTRVASDYKLDPDALVARYGVPPPPRHRRGRRPGPLFGSLDLSRSLSEEVLKTLSIPTLKKICKEFCVKVTGSRGDLLGRIRLYQLNPHDPLLKKKPASKSRRKARVPEPPHNHPPDDENHPECPQCVIYGNPLSRSFMDNNFKICICKDTSIPVALAPGPGLVLVTSID